MDHRLLIEAILCMMTVMTCVQGQGTDENSPFLPPSVTMNEPELIVKAPLAKFDMVCRATGAPTPVIRWYRDNDPVETSMMTTMTPEGTLTVLLMDQLQGKYQCKAENVFGVSQSNLTDVKMAFVHEFTSSDVISPTAVTEGDHLKLVCRYSDPFSYPIPNWTWLRQNTLEGTNPIQNQLDLNGRLSVDDRGNLYFQHVLGRDNLNDWYHMCQAWNPSQNIKKIGSPYKLKIKPRDPIPDQPPTLVYQNGNGGEITVIEGESIDMYCIFQGYPKVEVRWEKLGNTKKPFLNYLNGKTRVTIENSKNNDQFEGDYQCVGYQASLNLKATATGKFNVKVLQKPRIIDGPINTNVTEGGEVTFTCSAMAEPAAIIEWFVNGLPIVSLPFDARREVNGNKFKFTQLRRGTSPQNSDLQVVSCMARNEYKGKEIGRTYMDGYINVVLAMTIVTAPENFTISDSSINVVLNCEIKSDPSKTPDVSWHRNMAPITLEKDKFEKAPNNSLVIMTKNFDDLDDVTGEYMCVVEQKAPSERLTAKAWVDVKEGVVPIAPIASASINLWWIGLILVLLILLLIFLLICCLIRRNAGESYPVDEVERKMGNDPEKDLKDQGFHDYQRKEKNPIGGSRASLDSSMKPVDSDDDSMLEYGDIDDSKFNEDGSFIGQYANYDKSRDSQV